jgi:hypothetical protein
VGEETLLLAHRHSEASNNCTIFHFYSSPGVGSYVLLRRELLVTIQMVESPTMNSVSMTDGNETEATSAVVKV